MSGSVNKVILVGNVGRDPEVRRLNSGEPVCNFSLATTESWRDKATGERKERTEWHNVVIFNENLAKVAEQYVKKGSKLYIEGQLQTRKFTDKKLIIASHNQGKVREIRELLAPFGLVTLGAAATGFMRLGARQRQLAAAGVASPA